MLLYIKQQLSKLDIEFREDVNVRLSNFKPDINLINNHQLHPSN